MSEMKSLTLNGTKYDSFVDQTARDSIETLKQNGTGGTVSDEQIAQAVENYMKENPVDISGVVRTVNGVSPDENGNVKITIPDSGQNVDYVGVEPAEDDIPKVFFYGDITDMSKENEKVLQFAYKSKSADFGGYVKMKWQGSSTLAFPKKNFTIKMFEEESCETKIKKTFKNWGFEKNKYVLKADYIDHTHARNIVTANLWTEMVASRPDFDSLPDGMKNAPGHGAIDGFPIKLYMNGVYEGIYTWTIGKEDWMFGMDEDNANNAALCAEKNNNGNSATTDADILACEFRGNADIDETDWSLEFPDTLTDDIKISFNNLINCVKDTDDETFIATIGNYLDLTSAFDYYILAYLSANVDGLAKNLIMMTYDGVKWFCSAYDMDNIWGSRGTNTFVGAEYACPEDYYDNNSLLWQRIESCFGAEMYERYKEVRKTVLSFENVIDKFERFCDLIGTELYAEDVEIYPGIPYPTQNNLKQIRNFFTPRAEYVDGCFAKIATGETDDPDDTGGSGDSGESGGSGGLDGSGDPGDYVADGLVALLDARDLQSGDTVWNSKMNNLAFNMTGFDDSAIADNEVTFSGSQTVECAQEVNADNGFTIEFAIARLNIAKSCNRMFYHTMTPVAGCFVISHLYGWNGLSGWSVDTYGSDKIAVGAPQTNAWYTVAVTVECDGTKTIYVDGVQKATGETTAPIDMQTIMLGYHSTYTGEGFEGALNAFRLYNRVLTLDEIVSNYEADTSAFRSITSNELVTAYSLEEPVTVASTSDCFDTGTPLWATDVDFTIAFNVTSNNTSTTERTVFATNDTSSPWQGIKFDVTDFYKLKVIGATSQTITTQIPATYTDAIKAVITHRAGTSEYTIKYQYGGEIIEQTATSIFSAQTNNVWVGADNGWSGSPVRVWPGTINEFAIYYGVMSDEEIEAFLNG